LSAGFQQLLMCIKKFQIFENIRIRIVFFIRILKFK